MEHENAILTCQFKNHIICGWQKCNNCIMILNPHYSWEAKMQNPYVKHGTFLMQIEDLLKSIQRQQNCLN
jgi:hypothetical protein